MNEANSDIQKDREPVKTLRVVFPALHPDLIPLQLLGDAVLLDPGIVQEREDMYWRPDDLPLDPRTAQHFIQDCRNIGAHFKVPDELEYFAAAGLEDFYGNTSMAIRSELMEDQQDDAKLEKEILAYKEKAQKLLLLQWLWEEELMELEGVNEEMNTSWKRFEQSLGIEEEELREEGIQFSPEILGLDQLKQRVHKPVLEAFLVLMSRGGVLVTTEQGVKDVFEEMGVTFDVCPQDKLKEIGFSNTEAHAERAQVSGGELLKKKGPLSLPWLQARFDILFLQV